MAFELTRSESDYVALPTSSSYNADSDFSVALWAKHRTGTASTNEMIYFCGTDRGTLDDSVEIFFNSTFSLRVSVSISGQQARASGTQIFNGNTNWHHVVLVWDSSTQTVELFGDGVSLATATNVNVTGAISTAGHAFGANWNGGGGGGYENFGDIHVAEGGRWDRKLTDEEVASLAKGFAPSFFSESLVWYVPAIRNYVEEVGGLTVTNNGSAVSEHPPILYPSVEYLISSGAPALAITAPLLTASGLIASSSIDRNIEITAPLITSTGTIVSASIDRNGAISGVLLTATGEIPSDSILTGYVINAPLLTASGIQSSSFSYDGVLTAPLLSATGSNASVFTYERFITGALLTASSYIAGSITYDQFITAILVQASGINLPTFTFAQTVTAILLEASGLIPADSVRNLWMTVETPASNTWSDVEHDEDTLSWTDTEHDEDTLVWSNTEFKG